MELGLIKVLDKQFYIFKGATESFIEEKLPKNWTEKNIFYVNCDVKEELMSVAEAEKSWKTKKK